MTTPVAIYKIVNALNGRMYIGQSINPARRIQRHFWKQNGCVKLKHALEKYGKEHFYSSVIYWCEDKKDANDVEELLIALCDTRNNGYNITPGGNGTGEGKDNPFFGKRHSAELKAHWSASKRGSVMPDSTRKKIAEAAKKRVTSEATKAKLREIPKSDLCRQKTAEANKARVWTDAAREKLATYTRGKPMTEETKAKVIAANKARVWSDESRAKLSAAKTKR